jgi:hypothetical protein
VVNANGNNASVLLNTGSGSFGLATNFATGTAPLFIITGDFDSDGEEDLVTVNQTSNNVSVLKGTGTGSFGTAMYFPIAGSGFGATKADFNEDGRPDLATANLSSSNTSVLLNCDETGIINAAGEENISLFPNPADDQLAIANIPAGTNLLEITDVFGQLIYTDRIAASRVVINSQTFSSGVYFLTLTNERGEKHVIKFIRR